MRDAPNQEKGRQRALALIDELEQRDMPGAAACVQDDLEASLAHLKLPSRHRRTVRTTNLCERGFVEERRRAKVIPRFRGEKECLKLVFATLWRSSERWKKVKFTKLEREELDDTSRPDEPTDSRCVTSLSPLDSDRHVYSNFGT